MSIDSKIKDSMLDLYIKTLKVVYFYKYNNWDKKRDMAHDAFFHLLKRLETSYVEEGKMDSWINKVVINYCNDWVKKENNSNIFYFEDLMCEDYIPYNDGAVDRQEKVIIEIIYDLIEDLSEEDKKIFIAFSKKETIIAIAADLKRNKKTIKKHIEKIKPVLKKKALDKLSEGYEVKKQSDSL